MNIGSKRVAAIQGATSIEARDIWKTLRGQPVLTGASLIVRAGEAVGLFGASGSGKSTLFNIMLGVLPAERGEILLDGRPLDGLPTDARARLGLGYVPQRPYLPVHMTVRDALSMAAEGAGVREVAESTSTVMEALAISTLRNGTLGKLSGGERRRVEIGYVLVTRPRYLLLDEPFAGLDPIAVDSLIAMLGRIAETGIGILIAEHNRVDAARLTTRNYALDNGILTAFAANGPKTPTHRAMGFAL